MATRKLSELPGIMQSTTPTGSGEVQAINGGGLPIHGVGAPQDSEDAANKLYVDTAGENKIYRGFMYYAAASNGFYFSENGVDWTAGLTATNVRKFCSTSKYIWIAVNSGGSGNGYLGKSTDGGQSFTQYTTSNGLPVNDMLSCFAVGESIYAGSLAGGIAISHDAGETWKTSNHANNGLIDDTVNAIIYANNTIYAATNSGVCKSFDDGESWIDITPAAAGAANQFSLFAMGNMLWLGGNPSGLCYSDDYGDTWTQYTTSEGLVNNYVQDIWVDNSMDWYIATNAGISITHDGGQSFTNYTTSNSNLPNDIVRWLGLIDGKLYAACQTGGLGVSEDDGATWTTVNVGNGNMRWFGQRISIEAGNIPAISESDGNEIDDSSVASSEIVTKDYANNRYAPYPSASTTLYYSEQVISDLTLTQLFLSDEEVDNSDYTTSGSSPSEQNTVTFNRNGVYSIQPYIYAAKNSSTDTTTAFLNVKFGQAGSTVTIMSMIFMFGTTSVPIASAASRSIQLNVSENDVLYYEIQVTGPAEDFILGNVDTTITRIA